VITGFGALVLAMARSARATTRVIAVPVLLAVLGSVVLDVAVALFVRKVPSGKSWATCTTMVKLAASPLATVAFEMVTVPVEPTAGIETGQPGGAVAETNVVPGGRGSAMVTAWASLGPLFVRVTE
jgi:hypothetical protein